jgi:hypothetical protein
VEERGGMRKYKISIKSKKGQIIRKRCKKR